MDEMLATTEKISTTNRKNNKLKELFCIVGNSNPIVKIIKACDDEGDVRFEVTLESLNLSNDLFIKYKKEITSHFFISFMGELLIRQNIDEFAKLLINLKDSYASKVNSFSHKKFGMALIKNCFVFDFHISLVQTILTEDFGKRVL